MLTMMKQSTLILAAIACLAVVSSCTSNSASVSDPGGPTTASGLQPNIAGDTLLGPVAISGDGMVAAIGGNDSLYPRTGLGGNLVYVFDANTGNVLQRLADWGTNIELTRDGRRLMVSGDPSHAVTIFDVKTGAILRRFSNLSGASAAHLERMTGDTVLISDWVSGFNLFSVTTGELLQTYPLAAKSRMFGITGDDRTLVLSDPFNELWTMDLATGLKSSTYSNVTVNFGFATRTSPDCEWIVDWEQDSVSGLYLISVRTGQKSVMPVDVQGLPLIALSNDSAASAIISRSAQTSTMSIINPQTGATDKALPGSVADSLWGLSTSYQTLAFSEDGSRLVSVPLNHARVWHLK